MMLFLTIISVDIGLIVVFGHIISLQHPISSQLCQSVHVQVSTHVLGGLLTCRDLDRTFASLNFI